MQLQALFDFFKSRSNNEQAKIIGGTFNSVSFSYNNADLNKWYELYERNPYIRNAINKISDDVGKYGFEIKNNRGTIQPSDALTKLTQFFYGTTPKEFFKRFVRDYLVAGNVYIYTPREKKKIIGLGILDPRNMTTQVTDTGVLLGYVQNLNGSRYFSKDEITHIRYDSNVDNETEGLSKIGSLYLDLEIDEQSKKSNWAYFRNNRIPSTLVVLERDMDGVDVEAGLRKLVKGEDYSGGENKHQVGIFSGIKQVIQLATQDKDGDFLSMQEKIEDLVYKAFGVPPNILGGIGRANRAEGDISYEVYWDNIEGIEKILDEVITNVLREKFPSLQFNFLQDNLRKIERKADVAIKLIEHGIITVEDARDMLQY